MMHVEDETKRDHAANNMSRQAFTKIQQGATVITHLMTTGEFASQKLPFLSPKTQFTKAAAYTSITTAKWAINKWKLVIGGILCTGLCMLYYYNAYLAANNVWLNETIEKLEEDINALENKLKAANNNYNEVLQASANKVNYIKQESIKAKRAFIKREKLKLQRLVVSQIDRLIKNIAPKNTTNQQEETITEGTIRNKFAALNMAINKLKTSNSPYSLLVKSQKGSLTKKEKKISHSQQQYETLWVNHQDLQRTNEAIRHRAKVLDEENARQVKIIHQLQEQKNTYRIQTQVVRQGIRMLQKIAPAAATSNKGSAQKMIGLGTNQQQGTANLLGKNVHSDDTATKQPASEANACDISNACHTLQHELLKLANSKLLPTTFALIEEIREMQARHTYEAKKAREKIEEAMRFNERLAANNKQQEKALLALKNKAEALQDTKSDITSATWQLNREIKEQNEYNKELQTKKHEQERALGTLHKINNALQQTIEQLITTKVQFYQRKIDLTQRLEEALDLLRDVKSPFAPTIQEMEDKHSRSAQRLSAYETDIYIAEQDLQDLTQGLDKIDKYLIVTKACTQRIQITTTLLKNHTLQWLGKHQARKQHYNIGERVLDRLAYRQDQLVNDLGGVYSQAHQVLQSHISALNNLVETLITDLEGAYQVASQHLTS